MLSRPCSSIRASAGLLQLAMHATLGGANRFQAMRAAASLDLGSAIIARRAGADRRTCISTSSVAQASLHVALGRLGEVYRDALARSGSRIRRGCEAAAVAEQASSHCAGARRYDALVLPRRGDGAASTGRQRFPVHAARAARRGAAVVLVVRSEHGSFNVPGVHRPDAGVQLAGADDERAVVGLAPGHPSS